MEKQKSTKKKKLRSNVKIAIKLLLLVAVILVGFSYIFNLRIKNIYILGNDRIRDVEIIEIAGIKNYPAIYKLNKTKIKNSIKTIPLVSNVKVKRNIFGKLTIEIEENKILFLYKYNNKFIASNGEELPESKDYYGYPILINFTPDVVIKDLIDGLSKVDYEIVKMINEIEYSPYKAQDGTIIENNRFVLKMNDGNTVYIDTPNIKNLNKYITIYASPEMDQTKGVIYLDSMNDSRILFKSYDTIAREQAEAQAKVEEAQGNTE